MTDAEQIDAWRSEFQQKCAGMFLNSHAFEGRPFALHKNGEYFFAHAECAWQGFLMAKRSQPVIELPQPEDMYDKGDMWLGRFFADGYVHNAITAAGYKYKLKS